MNDLLQFLTLVAIIAATLFSVGGVIGFIRLPDVYTRLHAVGKISSFGVVLLIVAAILWVPLSPGKGLVMILFVLLAAPVAAHAISSAAYRIGLPFENYVRNDLVSASPFIEEKLDNAEELPLPEDIND